MKTTASIQRPALLALLSCGLGISAVHAQQPKEPKKLPSPDIENSDPFDKGAASADSKSPKILSAEMLDAQARILFARGETERAIAIQTQAVEKAKENVEKFSETLARYEGRPVDGPIARKLSQIIIPSIDFEETSLEEALDFLRQRAIELDTTESDPNRKGVNIVATRVISHEDPSAAPAEGKPTSPRVKGLVLRNVPLGEALRYLCEATGTHYKVDPYAVNLMPGAATKP